LKNSSIARSAVVAVTLLIASFTFPSETHACSCADIGTSPAAILRSDAVFRGTVIGYVVPWSLQPRADDTLGPVRGRVAAYTDAAVTVRMEVHEAWKGMDTREVVLDVGSGYCCDCSLGTSFGRPGQELLVYAYEHEGALHVGFCGPPIPIENAGPYLEALGPGRTSLERGRTGRHGLRTWTPIAAAVALAVALGLVWLRGTAARSPE
jgi:hypothetical protein